MSSQSSSYSLCSSGPQQGYGTASQAHDQLIKNIGGAYPANERTPRLQRFSASEGVFGSPKPHPNAVLDLFEAQNTGFAISFAAHRPATGGFSTLTSDKPAPALPRRTLATVIHDIREIGSLVSHATRVINYGGDFGEYRELSRRSMPHGVLFVGRTLH